MQKRSELYERAVDSGIKSGKSQFSNTQIWVFAKQPNLLLVLNRRKFADFPD